MAMGAGGGVDADGHENFIINNLCVMDRFEAVGRVTFLRVLRVSVVKKNQSRTSPGMPIFNLPSGFSTSIFTAYTKLTRSAFV